MVKTPRIPFDDPALAAEHSKQLRYYGAGGYKELPNGRIRYYDRMRVVSVPGVMIGNRRVREWDPQSGRKRTWFETLDQQNRVRRVRVVGADYYFEFNEHGHFIGKTPRPSSSDLGGG